MHRLSYSVMLAVVTTTTLAAQGRTLIVGPGGYSDFPAALAAAVDGDTIRLRDGKWTGGTITKAIRVVGDPSARFETKDQFPAIDIVGIPAGKTVTFEGVSAAITFLVEYQPRGDFLRVRDCDGNVHLDGLIATYGNVRFGTCRPLQISNCKNVSISDCVMQGGVNSIASSIVSIQDSRLTGAFGYYDSDPRSGLFRYSSSAMNVASSVVVVATSEVVGGSASPTLWPGFGAQPAIELSNSLMKLAGSKLRVAAGQDINLRTGSDGIVGVGQLLVDPRATIVGSTGSYVGYRQSMLAAFFRWPSLRVRGDTPGGTITGEVEGMATGDLVELYASLPGSPVTLPVDRLGTLWLDLPTLIVLGRGATLPTMPLSIPIPQDATLAGLPLTFQALVLSGTTLRFSTPATVVLD
ncbi:MAG: hypothetical protein KDC95_22845 [Planctomycetes bacterium]|nr:hypothetical protein [Planctomycetota bacterium]